MGARVFFVSLVGLLAMGQLAHAAPNDVWVWEEETILLASDGEDGDAFGLSVSLAGDRALVGAMYEDDAGDNAGAAYVFVRAGSVWTQEAKLVGSDTVQHDGFGFSVALDGDTAAIGAPNDWEPAGPDRPGSAFIFVRSGTSWTQQQKLWVSSLPSALIRGFGAAVALDGDTVLIGAPASVVSGGGFEAGCAYVYVRSGSTWTQQAFLQASGGKDYAYFGTAVSLDGDTALIGNADPDDEAAYVFVRTGTTWSEQTKLTQSDPNGGEFFGLNVALCGDTALVAARRDESAGVHSGSVYAFLRSGTIWSQDAEIHPSDIALGDQFGTSVALVGDIALIGSWGDDDVVNASGSAYLFQRTGTGWHERAKILSSDPSSTDSFGLPVSLDGDRALVGAYTDDSGGAEVGSVSVFRLCTSSAQALETPRLGTPPNPNVFLPGVTTGPIVGGTWDPVVSPFHPGAFLDFVAVDRVGPLNVPTAWGTLLIWPPPRPQFFFNVSPGTPFAIAIPLDCGLIGTSAWAQAGSVSLGPLIAFTNALDIVFGTQ